MEGRGEGAEPAGRAGPLESLAPDRPVEGAFSWEGLAGFPPGAWPRGTPEFCAGPGFEAGGAAEGAPTDGDGAGEPTDGAVMIRRTVASPTIVARAIPSPAAPRCVLELRLPIGGDSISSPCLPARRPPARCFPPGDLPVPFPMAY